MSAMSSHRPYFACVTYFSLQSKFRRDSINVGNYWLNFNSIMIKKIVFGFAIVWRWTKANQEENILSLLHKEIIETVCYLIAFYNF